MNRKPQLLAAAVTTVLVTASAAFALSSHRSTEAHAPAGQAAVSSSAMHGKAVQAAIRQSPREESKVEQGDENDTPDPTSAKLTPAEAATVALAAFPGGKVGGAPGLEDEDGTAVYGVGITAADGTKYDVKVDANTGKILKSESDDNDGEDGPNDGPDGDDTGPTGK